MDKIIKLPVNKITINLAGAVLLWALSFFIALIAPEHESVMKGWCIMMLMITGFAGGACFVAAFIGFQENKR